jgi:hypothetical protein
MSQFIRPHHACAHDSLYFGHAKAHEMRQSLALGT